MTIATSEAVGSSLHTLLQSGTTAGLTDCQLLERFVSGDDGARAAAFEALVERHGPMVSSVCRSLLGDLHAAEDASQATFLVLAQRACQVRRRDSLASWLFGVARRVALKSRRDLARRHEVERRGAEIAATRREAPAPSVDPAEVYEALQSLPSILSLPVILCDLEGLTHDQATHQLHWTLRTFQRRLERGRKGLRARLSRRGLNPASEIVLPLAPLTGGWARNTARAAVALVNGSTTRKIASTSAQFLAREVVRAMSIEKAGLLALKSVAGSLILAAGFGGVAWVTTLPLQSQENQQTAKDTVSYRGRVLGPDGKALEGATVSTDMSEVKVRSVKTGPDGAFTLVLTNPSIELSFHVEAAGFAPRTIPFGPVNLLPREITLNEGTTLEGQVIDQGKPAADVVVGLAHADGLGGRFLGHWEARTDDQGRFKFLNVPANEHYNLFGTMNSFKTRGALPTRKIQSGDLKSTRDAGQLSVEPAHGIKGRIVFTDGQVIPKGTRFQVGIENAWDSQVVPLDAAGRFQVAGVPKADVSAAVLFETAHGTMFTPEGYRLSAQNRCVQPDWPVRLLGRVDRDIDDLVILFEPGPDLPGRNDPRTLAEFKEIKAGPLTGVADPTP